MKLTPKAAQALTNLRANADFGHVLEWLKEVEDEERDHCVEYEGKDLHQAQGAAKILRKFKQSYDEAPHLLEKLKSQPHR